MPGNAALTTRADTFDVDDSAVLAPLQTATGYGLTTLQKATRVLAARGWIVLVRNGKNRLTVDERDELRRAGSVRSRRRNVWACTIPTHLRHPTGTVGNIVDNPTGREPAAGSGCDLPTTRRVGGTCPVGINKIFKPEQPSRTDAARRQPGGKRRGYRADPRTVRLARDLKARVYWLRSTPHQRIMPALDRFAKAGWSARDVLRELDQTLSRRAWQVPDARVRVTRRGQERRYPLRCPWDYLAMLLRTLEPTDLIAERAHAEAMRAARLHYEQLRRTGPECPHGEPAGDVPSPAKGIRACPLCRQQHTEGPVDEPIPQATDGPPE